MDSRVVRAIAMMEHGLGDHLAVPEVARQVELSVAQLTRLFRRDTGVTPRTFLQRLRLLRARTLLERTTMPIAEIMAQVGVSDRSHFARDFKRLYGLTPRTLRVQLRMRPGATRRACSG